MNAAASSRVGNTRGGFAASAAARASSSSVHRSLTPSPPAARTSTPNHPLASVNATTPPSECPSTATGPEPTTAATEAASDPNEYRAAGADRPCPGRSTTNHSPGHESAAGRHTEPVAPSPCSSTSNGPSPPRAT